MTEVRSAKFQAGFVLDQKASVEEAGDGSILIEGYAADWLMDRQEEAFEPGAFEEGVKAFLETNPILLYHHNPAQALGTVLEAKIEPAGLWVKAKVDKPAVGSWAEDVYNKIKSGTIRGFSVGGRFWRRGRPRPGGGPMTGGRIFKTDWTELSITPSPIGQTTLFQVAGKAFEEAEAEADDSRDQVRAGVAAWLDAIEAALDAEGKADRAKQAKSGVAMSDGAFPITHCGSDSYSNGAARARAHSGNASESAIMAHIRKREKALGCKSSDG